jgi:predicted nucleotidyltransferase
MTFDKSYVSQKLPDLELYFYETESVDVVYLFGLVAKDKSNKLSYIDFGILFNENVNPDKYFKLRLKFINKFSNIFKTHKIDIIILNNTSNLIDHNIIKANSIIFTRNEDHRI